MAEAQKSAAQAAGGRRGGLLRNLGPILALLPLGILAWPSLLLGGALLVPTLAAAIVDRSPQRYLTYAVGPLNLACTLPALIDLWRSGHQGALATALAANPDNWILAYLGAAAGLGIYLAMPPLAAGYYTLQTKSRLEDLNRRRDALQRNWGEEVAGPGS